MTLITMLFPNLSSSKLSVTCNFIQTNWFPGRPRKFKYLTAWRLKIKSVYLHDPPCKKQVFLREILKEKRERDEFIRDG